MLPWQNFKIQIGCFLKWDAPVQTQPLDMKQKARRGSLEWSKWSGYALTTGSFDLNIIEEADLPLSSNPFVYTTSMSKGDTKEVAAHGPDAQSFQGYSLPFSKRWETYPVLCKGNKKHWGNPPSPQMQHGYYQINGDLPIYVEQLAPQGQTFQKVCT